MLYDDTIAAIATPAGVGALGVIRLSGKDTLAVLEGCFRPVRPGPMRPFHMRYGHIVDAHANTIDEVLAVFMRAPHSFTAEHAAEISCHGGPLVLRKVLARILECGARLATPGEYSMRAFLNGRIDLTQAEATLDVINARTEAGLALAQAQLGGWLAQALQAIRQDVLAPLAYLTALIDFPEDEVEAQPVVEPLTRALTQLNSLIHSATQGIVLREGARAALVGRPNAGKSSLMNALLRMERAIVTAIPGTTRDTLEETASIAGVPLVLIDTAGITQTDNLVEQLGVERSKQALQAADIALLVVDASVPPEAADLEIAALTQGRPTLLILNKVDLLSDQETNEAGEDEAHKLLRWWAARYPERAFDAVIPLSALSGAGMDRLAQAIAQVLLGGRGLADAQLITNPRHREALERAAGHVQDALDSHARAAHHELQAIDLIAALAAIGEVTGEQIDRDLLDVIFSTFCIGK